MFYPSTYGHEAPSNTKVNQTLKTHLKPSGDFSFEICPSQQMNSEAGNSYMFTPLSMTYYHANHHCNTSDIIFFQVWLGHEYYTEWMNMVRYGHFPLKDPKHGSSNMTFKCIPPMVQAMNLTWKHDSHFFPASFWFLPLFKPGKTIGWKLKEAWALQEA